MGTPLRSGLSHALGWLSDRRIPVPLRAPVYRAYARLTGAQLSEVRTPLRGLPSLSAFFVRHLVDGARPIAADPELLPSPADGRIQSIDELRAGTLLQAKGRPYAVDELLGGPFGEQLEGALALTIYLSPRDYHRVHAPLDGRLHAVTWLAGERNSVAPSVLARRSRVLATNERCALALEEAGGRYWLVMVGALNVGRIRVVGVPSGRSGPLTPARPLARGEELARFELGSTVVLVLAPGGWSPLADLAPGRPVRLGEALARRRRGP